MGSTKLTTNCVDALSMHELFYSGSKWSSGVGVLLLLGDWTDGRTDDRESTPVKKNNLVDSWTVALALLLVLLVLQLLFPLQLSVVDLALCQIVQILDFQLVHICLCRPV